MPSDDDEAALTTGSHTISGEVGGNPKASYRVTLAVLAVATMAYALLQTMVAPALPQIQRDLHTSTSAVTWVLTVYLLTASIATPVFGRLGDMFGKEHVMLIVLVVFAVGCLISALSHSFAVLIIGRAVQGAGGAVFPLSFGIIRDEFPAEHVAAGIGFVSATFGIGAGAGLALSGVIVEHLSYEWIFWLGLVATVGAAIATKLFVPESPVKTPGRIDWLGAGLLSVALVALLLAISEGNVWGWTSARTLALFAASAVLLLGWVAFELRAVQPLIDMRLLALRGVWTTNVAGFLIGFGMFGSFILIPQFVQTPHSAGYGFGASVTEAGLFLLPTAAMMLLAGPGAGSLSSRLGARAPLQIGAALSAAAYALLAVAHSQKWHIYLLSGLLGIGIGFAFAAMANLIVRAVPQTQTGEATGMNTVMRTVGGAMGGQIAASIVSGHLATTGLPTVSGYTDAFVMSAIVAFASVGAALLVPADSTAQHSTAVIPLPAYASRPQAEDG
jgi:EmrB/QacA subfamily drug resistance transporter